MNNEKIKSDTRTRNWTFVLYPESAPDNWRQILEDEYIPWVESPLHDKCINEDNTPKKPHWHIVLLYEGKKSFEQIKEITDKLNAPTPQKVNSAIGVIRYMAHMDNPEKTQYSTHDIVAHGGADIAKYLKPTATDRYTAIKEMRQFVHQNAITEFSDLFDYAAENNDEWFSMLCDNSAYIIGQYITSLRNKSRAIDVRIAGADRVYVNVETGEIIETQLSGINPNE